MRKTVSALAAAAFLLTLSAAALSGTATDTVSRETDRFLETTHLNPANAAAFTAACDAYLARATALKTALEAETGAAGVETSLRAYDALNRILGAAGSDSGVVSQTSLSAETRDAARACSARVDTLSTEISLSRPIYARLRAIPAASADPATRFLLAREIAHYDRAGVGTDDATRARIRALQDRISENSIAFERNIAEGRKEVTATPAELAGLPADYLAAHRPAADGLIRISTDYPDLGPVMSYAGNEALRRRLTEANLTRAYPANNDLLRRIFDDRATLAGLLGRPNYATLVTENKMIGSPANAANFLGEVSRVAQAPSQRDYQLMLSRARQIDPAAAAVPYWSTAYLSQLIRKEQYDVDPQQVRQYFAYDNVRDGILQLTRDLFGVEIRRWETPLWAPGVEAYEIYEGGRLIGRFYMDNHPRPGKYNHANVIPIRHGLADRAVPVGILVCNFPAGRRDVFARIRSFAARHLLRAAAMGDSQYGRPRMGLHRGALADARKLGVGL